MSQNLDESLEGLAWLIAQLQGNATMSADVTGGVWPVQPPEGIPFTSLYAVVTPMGGRDVQGVAGYRLMFEGPYQVTFWGPATAYDTLAACATAADTLLQPGGHPSKGTSPDGLAQIISCLRDHPLPVRPDWTGQALRLGIGALWRLQVRSLP